MKEAGGTAGGESAIDFYEEDINRFIRSPVTEPRLSLLTARPDTSCGPIDPPAEPNTPIWPNLVNRPGLDLYAGPCENQLEHTIDLSSWAVDLAGSGRAEEGVRKRCREKKEYEHHLATRRARAGCSNPWTSACHEPHSGL